MSIPSCLLLQTSFRFFNLQRIAFLNLLCWIDPNRKFTFCHQELHPNITTIRRHNNTKGKSYLSFVADFRYRVSLQDELQATAACCDQATCCHTAACWKFSRPRTENQSLTNQKQTTAAQLPFPHQIRPRHGFFIFGGQMSTLRSRPRRCGLTRLASLAGPALAPRRSGPGHPSLTGFP